ncbi:MAG: DUF1670 domain-containing protein [Euryarchaeota archaeon]|nr:DUF1670 domain-containing protein [Euryarchaeota archaeon]MBU4071824.1 DUF1670 domain-containing protein [Candidatus Thermoplasmatota archaeon]MBU4144637.1 DUF1670 domain-containing protein [Candidatus Thermoplasmatota archaeon]
MSEAPFRKEYEPQLQRNLRTRLVNRFREKYKFMGGEEITQFIIDDILTIIEEDYRPMQMMRKGQLLWDGILIKQKRKPGRALSMKETLTKPIVLTFITDEDIEKLKSGAKMRDIRKDISERITKEAFEQGTVLNLTDVSLITTSSRGSVSGYLKEREAEKHIQLPTRGRIHDLGPSVTHKADILRMRFNKYTLMEIKRRTQHSTESIDRYHRDFDRVALLESKLSIEEISFVTGMSQRLIEEYIHLKHEMLSQDEGLGG